jgi:hypothetical protein
MGVTKIELKAAKKTALDSRPEAKEQWVTPAGADHSKVQGPGYRIER